MEVIILAGGRGTRLQTIVNDVPKPMAPINGKPFITYILNWITRFPVTKIILSVGYKASVIQNCFGDNYKGVTLVYAEEKEPLGTGGAIKFASSYTAEDDILIINGDTWFPISLTRLFKAHKENNASLTLALKHMERFDRYGTVNLSGAKIISFNEKEYKNEGLINGGIYVMNKTDLTFNDLPDAFSFEQSILEKRVGEGDFCGVVFNEQFIDIGIPEDYKKAVNLL